jgi:hemerythrin-like domain-containing protein
MCTYCGGDAETELCSLAYDHAEMEELVSQIDAALDADELCHAHELMNRLLDVFDNHVVLEESGLFRQLTDAGEAGEEVGYLEAEHRALRRELSVAALEGLRGVREPLRELLRHATREDTDLFRFAQQVLTDDHWASLRGHPHTRSVSAN